MAYSSLQGEILHMLCMQVWRRAGLAGLKSCPCRIQARLFPECASSYIRTDWPCLKQQLDDAAISNWYSSMTTSAVLGNETAREHVREFEQVRRINA